METGKDCPQCGKDIGYWPVFSAGLPNRIWCPHCTARLKYENSWDVLIILLAALTAITAAAAYISFIAVDVHARYVRPLLFIAIMFGAMIPLELVATWFLRNNKKLVCIDPGQSQFER